MAKISVIVPVYKTEQYLLRCVKSILSQSFQDLEVILVDDGSPDDCPQLCDELSAQDSRVHVIHQTNRGVAAARNTGLDHALGEYVTFVDSDDYLDPCMYEKMMINADCYSCDIVMCDCVKEYGTRSVVYSHPIRGGYYNLEQLRQEYYPHLLMMENVEYPPTISNWLCLVKRSLVSNKVNGRLPLRYVEGVRFSEDLLFGSQLMVYASSFYYMKGECYYHYCMNPSSATHVFKADKWKDYCVLHEKAEAFFLKICDYNFRPQLDRMILFFTYNAIGDIRATSTLDLNQKRLLTMDILNTPAVRAMFSRIHILQLPISWKLKVYTCLLKFQIGIRAILRRR